MRATDVISPVGRNDKTANFIHVEFCFISGSAIKFKPANPQIQPSILWLFPFPNEDRLCTKETIDV